MVPDERLLGSFDGRSGGPDLPGLCSGLFANQIRCWESMARAVSILKQARTREVLAEGFPVFLQFNPARVTSSEAKIDAAALAERPCFLCADNLPPEQRAVGYGSDWLVLCNPFPIFIPHFTIAHRRHRPQALRENLADFLGLARDLGPDFAIFYNGPRCGASAPDHLHFQAFPTGVLPMEGRDWTGGHRPLAVAGGARLWDGCQGGRRWFCVEGSLPDAVKGFLHGVMAILQTWSGDGEEPMVNLLAYFPKGSWRVFLFPRRKHRPEAFFLTGEARRAVTPGAVEMGGLIVTTAERDFLGLDGEEVVSLYGEVCMDGEGMSHVIRCLRGLFGGSGA